MSDAYHPGRLVFKTSSNVFRKVDMYMSIRNNLIVISAQSVEDAVTDIKHGRSFGRRIL